jgi:hypothetical protein
MTLQTFLSTFKTEGVQITVVDNNEELITFNASGYHYLEDTLEARVIKEWFITNPTRVKVVLQP